MRRRTITMAMAGCIVAAAMAACGSSKSPAGPVYDVLPVDSATVQAALDLLLGSGITVPPLCNANPVINCPSGVPGSPIVVSATSDSVHITAAGANEFNFAVWLEAATTSDIPVSFLGTNCGLHIDTRQGSSNNMELAGTARFGSATSPGGPINQVQLAVTSLSGVENADVAITGNATECVAANASIGTVLGLLVAQVQSLIAGQSTPLCGAPGPTLLAPCGTASLDLRQRGALASLVASRARAAFSGNAGALIVAAEARAPRPGIGPRGQHRQVM